MGQPVIQSLWIGARLSVMEQLSIRSYLAQGHAFHLYAYEPLENVPAGVVMRNAAEILGREEIFCYQSGPGKGSVAAFANSFRYKLLLERGGWWTDLDCVCLRALDFADEHVVGLQRELDGSQSANNGLIKAPAGSPLMAYCWNACQRADRSRLVWGQTGPRLLSEAIRVVDVPLRILDPVAFYPFNHWQEWQLIERGRIPADCYAIHLWHARWQQALMDPDAIYSTRSVYEQLKRRFDTRSPADAARGPTWEFLARRRRQKFQAARSRFKSIVRQCKATLRGSMLPRKVGSNLPVNARA